MAFVVQILDYYIWSSVKLWQDHKIALELIQPKWSPKRIEVGGLYKDG